MKATLEFDLPEDQNDLDLALSAKLMWASIWDFGQYLRSQNKYVEAENRDSILQVREKWFEMMGEVLNRLEGI